MTPLACVPLSTAMEQSTPVITPSVMASVRTNHLFVVCRRLWAFWEHLLPHRAPPVTIKDAAKSVVRLLSSQPPHHRHGSWSPLGHLERREPLGVWCHPLHSCHDRYVARSSKALAMLSEQKDGHESTFVLV
jgi:hypothetical protein